MAQTIYESTRVSSLGGSEVFPIYSSTVGGTVSVPLSVLLSYINANITASTWSVKYSAPSATGFSVSLVEYDEGENVRLILTPAAGYAAGTIVLPDEPHDLQEVLVNCTQSVTTLTINGSGYTVTGAPTTLAANAYFRLKYDAVGQAWYRIG